MASVKLTDKTLELLRNRPRTMTYATIAEAMKETCPQITASWLHQYVNGRHRFPHTDRIQALYEFLAGKPLLSE